MAADHASPVFVITPEPRTVTLDDVAAPARSPADARMPVTATVRVNGARGRKLALTLRAGGVAIDTEERDVATDSDTVRVTLDYVPTATGAMPLHVTATVGDEQDDADLVVDVRDEKWEIAFHDPRPSWMSTFVRRAIERDPRFSVTSRVVTSRDISSESGRPPVALADADVAAIIVGAPEVLTEREVEDLVSYMRRTGGGVILLLDTRTSGPYQRLTRVTRWQGNARESAMRIGRIDSDTSAMRAQTTTWPASLPPAAEPIATDSAGHPIVWRSPEGAGFVVVSGALDAWKYRDVAQSGFDVFWRNLIAETAANATPPIELLVRDAVLEPGEATDIVVTLRDAALARAGVTVRANAGAVIEGPSGSTNLRLWPDGSIGRFTAKYRAPAEPGLYRIRVTSEGAHQDAPVFVATGTSHANPDERELLAAWSSANGGAVLTSDRSGELTRLLDDAVGGSVRRETWHPMRSGWWIVPFTFLLAIEWWLRRTNSRDQRPGWGS